MFESIRGGVTKRSHVAGMLVKSMHLESLTLIICLFYASIALMDAKLKALWNLDKMSVCRLGYPATVYNNYGCWCGVGGSGKPMDGIDSP
uniref:Phospholipase A(2) n=1 Tax=Wuchereria bancrofti TaxID=6293 RepID=A0A1I8F0E5_WUCBA